MRAYVIKRNLLWPPHTTPDKGIELPLERTLREHTCLSLVAHKHNVPAIDGWYGERVCERPLVREPVRRTRRACMCLCEAQACVSACVAVSTYYYMSPAPVTQVEFLRKHFQTHPTLSLSPSCSRYDQCLLVCLAHAAKEAGQGVTGIICQAWGHCDRHHLLSAQTSSPVFPFMSLHTTAQLHGSSIQLHDYAASQPCTSRTSTVSNQPCEDRESGRRARVCINAHPQLKNPYVIH